MRCHKLLLVGAIVAGLVMPTQAAVYGTLKQDMYFDIDGNKVVKASGTGVSIIDEDELNYLIRIDNEKSDLVGKNLVKLQGTITNTTTNANIVSSVSKDATVLENVSEGEMVMALEKTGSFFKVKYNDTVGYIYNTSVDSSKLTDLIEESNEASKGEEVVSYAKQFLGGRYVYGGNNLATGVDCSGFAQQVMKHFNISLARSSREQCASNGYAVSEANIMPGDLVFYGRGSVDHVAIYAGNGQIIHANDESTGIIMSSLHYGKPIIAVKRVIK